MKVVHILQIVGLLLVVGYLFLLNTVNPQTVILPLLSPLPTALVIFLAVFIGWLLGWLPSRLRVRRLNRDNRGLRERLDRLERHLPVFGERSALTVIPDRRRES